MGSVRVKVRRPARAKPDGESDRGGAESEAAYPEQGGNGMDWWAWALIVAVVIALLGALRYELPALRRYMRMKGM